jgi:hypothetical protein
VDLRFEWVVRDEGMEVGIVLREEEFFLARVGIDLGRECVGNRFNDTVNTNWVSVLPLRVSE